MKIILNAVLLLPALISLNPNSQALAQSPAGLQLQWSNGLAVLEISGAASNACTVQYATNLAAVNPWHYLANFQPANEPALLVAGNTAASSLGFFRVFTQQLPTNVVPVTNMIWISPGTFTMGSPVSEALRGTNEPRHVVEISQGFYMGKYPVTQGEYRELIGTNPSAFSTNQGFESQDLSRPVERVSWNDATNYCALLTQQEIAANKLPANWVYRLPTESEWEYACRAGTTTAVYYGNRLLSGMANFNGTNEYDAAIGAIANPSGVYHEQTTAVGSYEPNAWGLCDMCGNVFEWCQDWFGSYPAGPVTDPQGTDNGEHTRVVRGGGWDDDGQYCRSSQRARILPISMAPNVGFRIVLAPAP